MRRPSRLLGPLAAGLALGTGIAAPAGAHEPQQRLEQLERAIGAEQETQRRLSREADALARELASLRERAVAMAAALQASEARLTALETQRVQLDADLADQEAAFAARRAELARLVAALARLSRQPPEAALVLPSTPVDMARTAQLLGTVTPSVERKAAALARDLDALEALRAEIAERERMVADAAAQLAAEREALGALIAKRASLQAETEAAKRSSAARIERLSREARDVRELIERLKAERAERERIAREAAEREAQASAAAPSAAAGIARLRPFSEARGHLAVPAQGRVVLSFGEAGSGGQPHRGLTIETRPAAQIVAPYDGQIVFAGPFRAYGLILIIEHSEGYHTLLAGLGRLDGVVGQWVTAGEPVGAAGSPESGHPSVYVELRRNGQPIDPLPWLASRNEKVSG